MPRSWLVLASIVVAFLIIAGRAVTYGYVWDDVHEIENAPAFDGPFIDGLTSTQTERTDPALTEAAGIELAYDSYRPVLFATYWVEVQIWGRAPGPMHATNLVLYVLAIVGAFLLARRLLTSDSLALVVAAVFALHPAQVEPVVYISGRGDLLVTVLSLGCVLAAIRGAEGRRAWSAVAAIAFLLAMFTKETAIGLPFAVAAVVWSQGLLKASRTTLVAMAVALAIYFAVRQLVAVPTTGGAIGRALVQLPGVWLEYLRIAVTPFDLSTERLHAARLALAGWVVALGVAGLLVVKRRHPDARSVTAGTIWFAVMLAPSAIAITSSGVAADRYFAAPLFGFALAITAAARAIVRARGSLRAPLQIAAVIWALLLVIVAWRQVPVWRTNETLYTHATAMTPESSDAFYRLGYLAATRDDWQQATPLLEHAVELDPKNVRALNNLAVGYLRTGREGEAEQVLVRAVEANPAAYRSWLNLGLARLALGHHDDGCAAVARALEIHPGYVQARDVQQARCRN